MSYAYTLNAQSTAFALVPVWLPIGVLLMVQILSSSIKITSDRSLLCFEVRQT